MSKDKDKTVRLPSKAHKEAKLEATRQDKTLAEWLSDVILKATSKSKDN